MSLYIEAGYDLEDLGGFQVDVVESGPAGSSYSISFAAGKHFLRTSAAAASGYYASKVTDFTSLLARLEAELNGATGNGTYTVSFDTSSQRVSIVHDGGGGDITAVAFTPATNGGLIGLTGTVSGGLSHELQRTPDYWISGAIGYWAENTDEYEDDEDVALDLIAFDGTPSGMERDGVPVHLDQVVPLEPRAMVYSRHAAASAPWTWQHLFRHCRNTKPLAIDDGAETTFYRLRAEGAAFKPRAITRDYEAYKDIVLAMRVLARL